MNISLSDVGAVKINNVDVNTVVFNGIEVWDCGETATEASGYPLTLQNARAGKLIGYKIYGNSAQDGTPSPESPVDVKSVGDLITDTASAYYGKYRIRLNATNGTDIKITDIYLAEPLRKVGSAVDYIDFANGRVVRNVKKYKFSDYIAIDYYSNRIAPEKWNTTVIALHFKDKKPTGGYDILSQNSMCNYFGNVGPMNAYTQAKAVHGTYSDHPTMSTVYIDIGSENNLYTQENPITNWQNWSNAYIVSVLQTPIIETVTLPKIIVPSGNVDITAETETKPSNINVIYKAKRI